MYYYSISVTSKSHLFKITTLIQELLLPQSKNYCPNPRTTALIQELLHQSKNYCPNPRITAPIQELLPNPRTTALIQEIQPQSKNYYPIPSNPPSSYIFTEPPLSCSSVYVSGTRIQSSTGHDNPTDMTRHPSIHGCPGEYSVALG